MIGRSRFVGWSRYVRLSFGVDRNSLVRDFSNIAIISIGSVLDMLGSTIRKSDRVGSTYTFTITGFSSIEGSLGVVISDSVLIGVGLSRTIISRFMVCWSRRMVGWSMNNRLVNNSNWGRVVGSRGWVSNHCWLVNNNRGRVIGSRGRVVGSSMVNWDWGNMVDRGRMRYNNRALEDRSVAGVGWSVGGRKSSRSMNSS